MKRILLSASLALLAGAVALPAAAQHGPPPWAPAHGWRAKHRYVYYPDSEVYYAPDTRMWFWLDGGDWRSGVSLPLGLQAYVRVGGVDIELGTAQPWVEHTYVVDHYGGRRVDWHRRDYDRDRDHGDGDPDRGHGHGRGHGHDH
jgi:hypothetical protein